MNAYDDDGVFVLEQTTTINPDGSVIVEQVIDPNRLRDDPFEEEICDDLED